MALERTAAVEALTDLVVATFALNGRFLEAGEALARPVGLTAAWWQVLGAALREPRTVSEIARHMGITRQSVQRIADVLVEREIAAYIDNPAHRTARLLRPLPRGRQAIAALVDEQTAWAHRVISAADIDADELRTALDVITRLTTSLPAVRPTDAKVAGSSPAPGVGHPKMRADEVIR